MINRERSVDGPRRRQATARGYLMCPPEHFAVTYAINPWMEPEKPTDAANAMRQWAELRQAYLDLGHDVRTIEPVAGLPDMVFAANGATVVGGKVLGARFRYPQRAAEAAAYLEWFRDSGYEQVQEASLGNEGEGGIPDTAMYYPAAFDAAGLAALSELFPELIEAKDEDAEVLGLNAVSDGLHVVLPVQARGLAAQLRERGFEPVGVDLSELLKGGGGPKCCTLELR